jgi:ribonuclease HI
MDVRTPKSAQPKHRKDLTESPPNPNQTTQLWTTTCHWWEEGNKKNQKACLQNKNITFNPLTTTKENLADGFRIFIDKTKVSNTPTECQCRAQGINLENKLKTIYTNSACANNGKANTRCRAGIWLTEDNNQNQAIRMPGNEQSNQVGEIAAIIKAIETTANCIPLLIKSDSKYAIDGLTTHLENWEDQGWLGIKNSTWFKRVAYLFRARSTPTYFQWVRGHNGELSNERSNKLAKNRMEKKEPDTFSLEIPERFDLQGAKLLKITQAIAYKGINHQKTRHSRNTMSNNLERIREDIHTHSGQQEKDETIWKSTHKRSITTKIGQFLFNVIHRTQKIENYWTHP